MHLALRLEDGTEVEDTFGGEPLRFVVGDGTLAPELERLILGLEEGSHRRLTLSPEHAFGSPDPGNVHLLPRTDFPSNMGLSRGMLIGFETPAGREIPGRIEALFADAVAVDFNHPLAGRRFTFEVQVLSVSVAA